MLKSRPNCVDPTCLLQRASRRKFVRNWVSLSNEQTRQRSAEDDFLNSSKIAFHAFGAAGMKIQISASVLALQFELPILQAMCGRVYVKFTEV